MYGLFLTMLALILQPFNGQFEAEQKFVGNFVQKPKVSCSSMLNDVFDGYKTPLCTQKYFSLPVLALGNVQNKRALFSTYEKSFP